MSKSNVITFLILLLCFSINSSLYPIATQSIFEDSLRFRINTKIHKGRIFNKKFITQERARKEMTVVFDLDATITYNGVNDQYVLRPFIRMFLKLCKEFDARIVLWTFSTDEKIEIFFTQHPDLLDYFDLLIPSGAFTAPKRNEIEEAYGVKEADSVSEYYDENLLMVKDLALLGYDIIVEDNKEVFSHQHNSPTGHYKILSLQPFDSKHGFTVEAFKLRYYHFYRMLFLQNKQNTLRLLNSKA